MSTPPHVAELLLESTTEEPDNRRLGAVRAWFVASKRKVIVVDDDPTGTQTTADSHLITSWEDNDIGWLLDQPSDIGFVLTNTRSLRAPDAAGINYVVGKRVRAAARQRGMGVELVSRSDSTLRGHFPVEPEALRDGAAMHEAGTVVMPFFEEGGRITVNGVHYVNTADGYVAVADTPFARDHTFGFESSDLREWVAEKTNGGVRSTDVGLVDLRMMRTGGPTAVASYLQRRPRGSICVIDAVTYDDVLTAVAGLQQSQTDGRRWVYRSAASLITALTGRRAALPVEPRGVDAAAGGLVIVGSHVPLSSAQLEHLLHEQETDHVEVSAQLLASDGEAPAEIARTLAAVTQSLQDGRICVVSTTRTVVASRHTPLQTSSSIARGLSALVNRLTVRPAYLVAKGGITSHTLAVDGLGARRSRVIGPIIAGVPMWEMGSATRFPGLPYVVFPGNVGTTTSLTAVVRRLEDARP